MSQSDQRVNIVPTLEELRSMRIMVVDDIPTNIILIKAILEHGGFTNIVSASNGKKALEYLEANPRGSQQAIDVLLLDIIMPAMDGFTLCRHLRNNPECTDIPIIMVTSEDKWREETARASFDAGAIDIMFKPVRSSELLPRIISALSLKRERDIRAYNERASLHRLEQLTFLEKQYLYETTHHPETGLFSRKRLLKTLEQHLQDNQRSEHSCLINIHIENAVEIKSCFGQEAYYSLLRAFAEKINADCRPTDSMYYLDDRHLAIFCRGQQREHVGHLIASLSSIDRVKDTRYGGETAITLSLGCVFDKNFAIEDTDDFITLSELALHKANQQHKNIYKLEAEDIIGTLFDAQANISDNRDFTAHAVKAVNKYTHDMLYLKNIKDTAFTTVKQIAHALKLCQRYSLQDYKIIFRIDTALLGSEEMMQELAACMGSLYLEPANFILVLNNRDRAIYSNTLRNAISTQSEQGFVFALTGIGEDDLTTKAVKRLNLSYLILGVTAQPAISHSNNKLEYCRALIEQAHSNNCMVIAESSRNVELINQLQVDFIIGNELSLTEASTDETQQS